MVDKDNCFFTYDNTLSINQDNILDKDWFVVSSLNQPYISNENNINDLSLSHLKDKKEKINEVEAKNLM